MRLPVRNSGLVKHTYIEETPVQIQLFQRKVVDKNVYATIPKGIMGGFEFTFLPKKIWKNGTKVFERMFTSSTKVGSTAAVLRTVH